MSAVGVIVFEVDIFFLAKDKFCQTDTLPYARKSIYRTGKRLAIGSALKILKAAKDLAAYNLRTSRRDRL